MAGDRVGKRGQVDRGELGVHAQPGPVGQAQLAPHKLVPQRVADLGSLGTAIDPGEVIRGIGEASVDPGSAVDAAVLLPTVLVLPVARGHPVTQGFQDFLEAVGYLDQVILAGRDLLEQVRLVLDLPDQLAVPVIDVARALARPSPM